MDGKVLAGPVPPDYHELPEDERLAVAAWLADQIRDSGTPRPAGEG